MRSTWYIIIFWSWYIARLLNILSSCLVGMSTLICSALWMWLLSPCMLLITHPLEQHTACRTHHQSGSWHTIPFLPFSSVISLYYITVPFLGFSLILAKMQEPQWVKQKFNLSSFGYIGKSVRTGEAHHDTSSEYPCSLQWLVLREFLCLRWCLSI